MREIKRVVITGIGVISPIGTGKDRFWEALMEGRSGVGPIQGFDSCGFDTRIAAEVPDFSAEDYIERKEARHMDRFTQFAVAAAKLAITDAGLDISAEDRDRIGVMVGSGIGGIRTFEDQVRVLHERGPGRVSPFFVPMMIADMAAGQISIMTGARGPNQTIISACATGTHSIGDAFRIIQRGEADVMIAGGSEAAVTPMAVAGFSASKALSTRNDCPKEASRPFDLDRDGFVIGEGSGILVLESEEHAASRGARVYAELVGYGSTSDAYHITQPAPDGDGAARAMAKALVDADVTPAEVDYINAHGTSTKLNDAIETRAIKRVFGEEAARKVAISSTKSMTGHLLGAAGGVEAVVVSLAIEKGWIPPTINYRTPDPECDLDYVPNTPRRRDVRVAMSNSFGFGGHNAVLVFKGSGAAGDVGDSGAVGDSSLMGS